MTGFLEMSSAEFRRRFIDKEYYGPRSQNKFNAKKTQVGDKVYDSKKEALRGQTLEEMQRCGKIWGLERQRSFCLIEPFVYHGKKIRGISWVSDFYYFDMALQTWVAEDVKSPITRRQQDYRIKMKLFMLKYPNILFKETL